MRPSFKPALLVSCWKSANAFRSGLMFIGPLDMQPTCIDDGLAEVNQDGWGSIGI